MYTPLAFFLLFFIPHIVVNDYTYNYYTIRFTIIHFTIIYILEKLTELFGGLENEELFEFWVNRAFAHGCMVYTA